MTADHVKAEHVARLWCNDEQSSTGNLARCYLDLVERVAALEAKQEAVRSDMRNALDMVDRMIETVDGGTDSGGEKCVACGVHPQEPGGSGLCHACDRDEGSAALET